MDNSQQHNIDLFLRKELAPSEIEDFNEQLKSNPDFKKEFDFQKEVFEGINHYRHAQLKARLVSIDVSGLGSPGLLTSGISKVILGAGLISSLGLMTWYFTKDSNFDASQIPKTEQISAPVNITAVDWTWKLPEQKAIKKVSSAHSFLSTKPVEKVKESTLVKGDDQVVEVQKEVKEPNFSVNIKKPNLSSMSDDDRFKSEIVDKSMMNPSTVSNTVSDPVSVQVKKSTGKLQYKYFDGKLFLLGDFTIEPYEILEINKKSGREIFLFFKESYYLIETTSKYSILKAIQEVHLIKELDILKQNKTE